jgi:hypothetical protein
MAEVDAYDKQRGILPGQVRLWQERNGIFARVIGPLQDITTL